MSGSAAVPVTYDKVTFDLPFARAVNPFADAVIGHTLGWARDTGLIRDEATALRLRSEKLLDAGPRLVPHASLTQAKLISDWTIFLIAIDDEFDEEDLGSQAELAEVAITEVLAGSRGQPLDDQGFPRLRVYADALGQLNRRFARMAPSPAWLERFAQHAEEHIWSKVVEARHREAGQPLGVAEYIALRRVSGAPYTYADVAELVEHVQIPNEVRSSEPWRQLVDAFADAFIGIQDVCSCAKEVATGDDLNLAAVMARAAGSTLQEGVDEASRWVGSRTRELAHARLRLERLILELELEDAAALDALRYAGALETLLAGHLAWNSEDNPRYTGRVAVA